MNAHQAMRDAVEDVVASLTDEVRPDAAERDAMWETVEALSAAIAEAIDERDLDAEVLHVGSTARDTWLAGDRDIDLFVQFPAGTDRETLTDGGLAVGRAVLADGQATYAEHPYITGSYDGFDVDIVPCIDVDTASAAETAVDRTPFHNAYVSAHLDDHLTDDVRVAKELFDRIDAYGSDLKTRGFGGYLLELLVIAHGGLPALLVDLATWRPPVHIDLAEHASASFDDPLVVIDPTDPRRNVAAVTTATQLARAQHYTRRLLAEGDPATFETPSRSALSAAALSTELESRGTELVAIALDRPELIDDQLWPQLRKTEGGISDALDRAGFAVVRSAILEADDRLALVFECGVAKRPRIERHEGPPVAFAEHADRFLESHAEAETYGPFIEDDRYIVERLREVRTPRALLQSERLREVRLGEQLRDELAAGYTVLVDEELSALLPAFATELAAYFDPVP